ncbi:MAG: hypothetical protein ACE5H3_06005 [Planctomycetota bacterium]
MNRDWLDELLDRHPGAQAPEGFSARLQGRLRGGAALPAALERRPALRPLFKRVLPLAAAAAFFLALGFWLGRGAPSLERLNTSGETRAEAALLEDLDLLQAMDLLTDENAELGLVRDGDEVWPEEAQR